MKNRYLPLMATLALGTAALTAQAQDETDALRYGQLSPMGTARSTGFGNALGSVGGDFTSLSVNPAGIGVYRTGEMTFTPSIKINSARGTYLGTSATDDATRFNINNFGMVFTNAKKGQRYDKAKWKTTSFGIGFNRLADFHRNYAYTGYNSGASSSSGSEVFVADANNLSLADSAQLGNTNRPAGLGYQSYLINYDGVNNSFYTVVPYVSGIQQSRNVSERGRYNEMVLSFGGNYMEKLLLGGTVGIDMLRYRRSSTYTESTDQPNPDNFSSYTMTDELLTKGTGINLKLGFIYKATDQFRFGAAVHTPTYFSLTDEYSTSLRSQVDFYSNSASSDIGLYNYTYSSPWRSVLSATGIMGKVGFISADVEFVGYNTSRFSFNIEEADYERFINQSIRNSYKSATNIRVGAEVRPTDILMVRAGFGYYGSPYKNSAVNGDRIDISAGIGFRFQDWFLDFGLVNSSYKIAEQPYLLPYPEVVVPTATIKHNRNNAALTIGFKF
ncbi:MAG: outer membrane protein transport protein [Flavipsychrobacter sp.]|nr:outer membrane protein transport protein [Flavipsychrobacter sp.]